MPNNRLVRLHQYHDAHTVHKVLVKLQPVEEKAFLAEYQSQVGCGWIANSSVAVFTTQVSICSCR